MKPKSMLLTALAMIGEPTNHKQPNNKPLKVCQCGTAYNHRGYQCKKCHQENNHD